MYDRLQTFSRAELNIIHDATMDLLSNVGVVFNNAEALEYFKQGGFKIEGKTVLIKERDINRAIESAPTRFRVTARDPAKNLSIGGDSLALAPGYGAPFIITSAGRQRNATMADYENFCKLVQTSDIINVNGFLMVMPADIPARTAYLDMIHANIVLCDKPFMGSPMGKEGARDCLKMAGIVWGNEEVLKEKTVMISLITPFSPLQFTAEMIESMIEFASYNQACIFGALLMAGSSGPVSLAGLLAQQNAEVLAGLTFTQLVNPGAPVIIGGTSSIMDLRTGELAMGAPEVAKIISATIQMAQFYGLPARAGCAVTNAHLPDAQAGFESAINLYVAMRNGSNFILHAAGILGSYSAMSFEKFIIDEELCTMFRESLKPIAITDQSIDLDQIKEVGIGGDYLKHHKTFEQCRTGFFISNLVNRKSYAQWCEEGAKRIDEQATDIFEKRIGAYAKPDIDPEIEKDLADYVRKRKGS